MADDMPSRVAVLEEIARNTETMLAEIRADIREVRDAQRGDFRWMMTVWISGMAALLAVMAHGFHWL